MAVHRCPLAPIRIAYPRRTPRRSREQPQSHRHMAGRPDQRPHREHRPDDRPPRLRHRQEGGPSSCEGPAGAVGRGEVAGALEGCHGRLPRFGRLREVSSPSALRADGILAASLVAHERAASPRGADARASWPIKWMHRNNSTCARRRWCDMAIRTRPRVAGWCRSPDRRWRPARAPRWAAGCPSRRSPSASSSTSLRPAP